MQLSPSELAQVKALTDRAYVHLHPDVRLYLNAQLLECTNHWEVADWLERLEATAKYFEEPSKPARRVSRQFIAASSK